MLHENPHLGHPTLVLGGFTSHRGLGEGESGGPGGAARGGRGASRPHDFGTSGGDVADLRGRRAVFRDPSPLVDPAQAHRSRTATCASRSRAGPVVAGGGIAVRCCAQCAADDDGRPRQRKDAPLRCAGTGGRWPHGPYRTARRIRGQRPVYDSRIRTPRSSGRPHIGRTAFLHRAWSRKPDDLPPRLVNPVR